MTAFRHYHGGKERANASKIADTSEAATLVRMSVRDNPDMGCIVLATHRHIVRLLSCMAIRSLYL